MVFSYRNFQGGILLRVTGLVVTLALLAWMATHTSWYVTMLLCAALAVTQIVRLIRFATRAGM